MIWQLLNWDQVSRSVGFYANYYLVFTYATGVTLFILLYGYSLYLNWGRGVGKRTKKRRALKNAYS